MRRIYSQSFTVHPANKLSKMAAPIRKVSVEFFYDVISAYSWFAFEVGRLFHEDTQDFSSLQQTVSDDCCAKNCCFDLLKTISCSDVLQFRIFVVNR